MNINIYDARKAVLRWMATAVGADEQIRDVYRRILNARGRESKELMRNLAATAKKEDKKP